MRSSEKPRLLSHYKVRAVFTGGGMVHLASWSEPTRSLNSQAWEAEWISDPDYGDTIGCIDWSAVSAVTWRFHES